MDLQERITNLEAGNVSTPVIKSIAPIQKDMPVVKTNTIPVSEPKKEEIEKEEKIKNTKPKETVKEQVQETEKVTVVEEETPVPLSNPAQNNGLKELWASLLQNISSPSAAALLNQHATPIEINENNIIIGCKPNFLNMLNSESKKKSIEDGAQKLFNKSVNVTVKTVDAKEIENISEKKNQINEPPKATVSKPKELNSQPQETTDEDDYAEYELAKKKSEKIIQSDQVSMVMNLFDGKFIDD